MKKIIAMLATFILFILIASPSSARRWDWELPGSISTTIEDQAEIKYPNKSGMRSYYCRKQAQAWLNIDNTSKPSGFKDCDLKNIKTAAAVEWPEDYEMQYDQIKKQISAWLSFKNYKKPADFKSSYKFKKLKKKYKREYPRNFEMRLYDFKKAVAEECL